MRSDYGILCFDIETYNPEGKSDPKIDPIIMISYASSSKKGVLTWKACSKKYCETLRNEKEMIERFKEIIMEENPAFLASYNGDNFDIPYIIERAKINKTNFNIGWDGSGVRVSKKALRGTSCQVTGMVNFDLYPFIATTMGTYLKTETYTLDAVSEELLGEKKEEYEIASLASQWDKGEINEAVKYSLKDSELTLKLCQKIMPLLYELSRTIGAKPSLASRMGYSKMVELLNEKNKGIQHGHPKIPSRQELSQGLGKHSREHSFTSQYQGL